MGERRREKKELKSDVRSRCDTFIGCRCVYKGLLRGQYDVDLLMVKNGNDILGQFFFHAYCIRNLCEQGIRTGVSFSIFNFTPSIMEKLCCKVVFF